MVTITVNATYPPDEYTEGVLQRHVESGSRVHELNVEVQNGASDPSVDDVFASIVPHGARVQCLSVRYDTKPERSLVNASRVLEQVESVHVISPVISVDDVERCTHLVKKHDHVKIRLTGYSEGSEISEILRQFVEANRGPGDPYVRVEHKDDYVLIVSDPNLERNSRPLETSDERLAVLGHEGSLEYIYHNKNV